MTADTLPTHSAGNPRAFQFHTTWRETPIASANACWESNFANAFSNPLMGRIVNHGLTRCQIVVDLGKLVVYYSPISYPHTAEKEGEMQYRMDNAARELCTLVREETIHRYSDGRPETWFVVRFADGGSLCVHPSRLLPA